MGFQKACGTRYENEAMLILPIKSFIFREYDIRGIAGRDLIFAMARILGKDSGVYRGNEGAECSGGPEQPGPARRNCDRRLPRDSWRPDSGVPPGGEVE